MSTPIPTPGDSPLVERIDTDTEYLHVTPTFGGLLKVAQFGTNGPGESMQGAVSAVTVYGDGRIEYHPAQVEAMPWQPNGGHDSDCAYVGGIDPNCTCSPEDGEPA